MFIGINNMILVLKSEHTADPSNTYHIFRLISQDFMQKLVHVLSFKSKVDKDLVLGDL